METFAAALAPLSSVCRPPLGEEQVRGYYAALSDICPKVLLIAASKIVVTRKYPTFPMPAEIREVAAEIMCGQSGVVTPAQAWQLAYDAACRIDPANNSVYR